MSAQLRTTDRASGHQLKREMEAAEIVKAQVAALAGDDPEFMRDAIEGETDLLETIEAVCATLLEDQAMCEAIDAQVRRLQDRKDRIGNRIELKRSLIASAMDVAERSKIETAVATLSLKPVPPKVEVVQEADIPAEFWKAQPPKLDRKALLEALKGSKPIPGARLSNGSTTVSIRQ